MADRFSSLAGPAPGQGAPPSRGAPSFGGTFGNSRGFGESTSFGGGRRDAPPSLSGDSRGSVSFGGGGRFGGGPATGDVNGDAGVGARFGDVGAGSRFGDAGAGSRFGDMGAGSRFGGLQGGDARGDVRGDAPSRFSSLAQRDAPFAPPPERVVPERFSGLASEPGAPARSGGEGSSFGRAPISVFQKEREGGGGFSSNAAFARSDGEGARRPMPEAFNNSRREEGGGDARFGERGGNYSNPAFGGGDRGGERGGNYSNPAFGGGDRGGERGDRDRGGGYHSNPAFGGDRDGGGMRGSGMQRGSGGGGLDFNSTNTQRTTDDRFKINLLSLSGKPSSAAAVAAAVSATGKSGAYVAPGQRPASTSASAAPATAAQSDINGGVGPAKSIGGAASSIALSSAFGDEIVRATFQKSLERVLEELGSDVSRDAAKKAASSVGKLTAANTALLVPYAIELSINYAIAAETTGDAETIGALLPALLAADKKTPAVATDALIIAGLENGVASLPALEAAGVIEYPAAKLYHVITELLATKGCPIKRDALGAGAQALLERHPTTDVEDLLAAEAAADAAVAEPARIAETLKSVNIGSWGDAVEGAAVVPSTNAKAAAKPTATAAAPAATDDDEPLRAAADVVGTGLLGADLAKSALDNLSCFKGSEAAAALMTAVLNVSSV